MDQITLTIDMSTQDLGSDEATDIGKSISKLLESALAGKKIGNLREAESGQNTVKISIRSNKPEEAIPVIESIISGHKLRRLMKIKHES